MTARDLGAADTPDAGPSGPSASNGCCEAATAATTENAAPRPTPTPADRFAVALPDGLARVDLLTPDLHCAGCIRTVERGLGETQGVAQARVNLAKKRVAVTFDPAEAGVQDVVDRLAGLGFPATPFAKREADAQAADGAGRDLLMRLAVAGFATANVMLLSLSVWTGATDATRDLMHWISAAIALPTILYAGQPFFRSALKALSAGRLNMDVPISLAVILAASVSLYETAMSGPHAYFDAGVALLFFLLIGRYLDHRTRGLARSAAAELSALAAASATRVTADCGHQEVPIDVLEKGDLLFVAPGARIPADGVVATGRSDVDRSMLTGEPTPEPVGAGETVHAGMVNLTGPLTVRVTATEEGTLLAEIARLVEAAERADTRFTRLADQAAKLYAPGVHIVAGLAFLGWMAATGGDWRVSVMVAAATLIITCPCALGLAVPAVHAAACDRLFRKGVLVKDGAALERLAAVDIAVFDKTGTVTSGRPELAERGADAEVAPMALALAQASRHPLSRALAEGLSASGVATARLRDVTERPGDGVEGVCEGPDGQTRTVRLGRGAWVSEIAPGLSPAGAEAVEDGFSRVWAATSDGAAAAYAFRDELRPDAADVMARLRALGLETRLLSGDRAGAVARVAETLGLDGHGAERRPAEKLADLDALSADGRMTLMVGDGVNDAPALAAASVSISPATAADVSRASADLVFLGDHLAPVADAVAIARRAHARARENFAIATLYNAIAIPIAVAGFATPMLAAIAMSTSSIIVTLNALRLNGAPPAKPFRPRRKADRTRQTAGPAQLRPVAPSSRQEARA